jgi:hypothetical protein
MKPERKKTRIQFISFSFFLAFRGMLPYDMVIAAAVVAGGIFNGGVNITTVLNIDSASFSYHITLYPYSTM